MEGVQEIRHTCGRKINEIFRKIQEIEERPLQKSYAETKLQLDTLYKEFREVLKVCKPYFKD